MKRMLDAATRVKLHPIFRFPAGEDWSVYDPHIAVDTAGEEPKVCHDHGVCQVQYPPPV